MSYKNNKTPDDYSGPERRSHTRKYDEDAIERLEQIVQNKEAMETLKQSSIPESDNYFVTAKHLM